MIEAYAITDPVHVAIILIVWLLLVYHGAVGLAFGVYAAVLSWAYNVGVGPTNLMWVTVAMLILSAVSRSIRKSLTHGRLDLPTDLRGFLAWATAWAVWMIAVYLAFPSDFAELPLKNMILYGWLSFLVVAFWIDHEAEGTWMVRSFVAVTSIAGLVSLTILPVPLFEAAQDPKFQLRGLSGINYLTFAVPFALSLLFALVRIVESRAVFERVGLSLCLPVLVVSLLLTGARQSIVALGIAGIAMVFLLWRNGRLGPSLGVSIVSCLLLGGGVYATSNIADRWQLVSSAYELRSDIWEDGWLAFLQSPLFGNGFDYLGQGRTAHDLALDVMASQGLIGTIFAVGFIWICLRGLDKNEALDSRPPRSSVQIAALSSLCFTLVQTAVTGGLTGAPHFFWVAALVWRTGGLGPMASIHTTLAPASGRRKRGLRRKNALAVPKEYR